MGSAMAPLDRALVSPNRLSIVIMPLSEAGWPLFAMQVIGVQSVPPFGEMGGCRGPELVP